MLNNLFPKKFDNEFRGYKFSLWFFYLLTAVTLWRSQHHVFSADGGAQSIATIPLDKYPGAASDTIVAVFSLWGLSQLILGLLYLLSCFRYKSMIPLFYLLAVLEYFVRFAYVGFFKPIETVGTAPGAMINLPFTIILIGLLFFALKVPRKKI
ncbi:MAG: hypothetical protein COB20_04740 [SAR86 cluster bacterium]|uniref:Uncharacterized protein n=1 Tax=SAR86 cluster bacterium TaxID=2030880 RepID=A0A2A4X9W4_9GAMM|nr:MAG: hypothetical protein COB20_04740 [SAR86 cluster bacterium]